MGKSGQERLDVIAIDGPVGSGKSTVSRRVADELGLLYVDTGAMYRALTLKAMTEGISMADTRALIRLSEALDINFEYGKDGSLKVYLDKKDVTLLIRESDVTENVKFAAKIKGVRENMLKLQRSMVKAREGAVLEGRDIGTVVFPDAKYKFYIDASFDERVRRRYNELKEKGMEVMLDRLKSNVESRDTSDIKRKYAPLKKADDAVYIDTTDMSIEEVVKKIVDLVKKKTPAKEK